MKEEQTASRAERVAPYNSVEKKGSQVERMFDSIAPAYDRMNALMSLGLHHHWRDSALEMAVKMYEQNAPKSSKETPREILDVACGTGDLSFKLADMFKAARIVGVDLSDGMLAIARKKLAQESPNDFDRIKFEQANCLQLPYDDNSFDMITVAYGVRNFEHLEQGYKEMLRVLRPGGVICVIELSEPASFLTKMLYRIYSRCLIPVIGKFFSGDYKAYSYLPQSIAATPQRLSMAQMMRQAGFRKCYWKSMTMGVVTSYISIKPFEN